VIAVAPCALEQARDFALAPRCRPSLRCAVAHAEGWIRISYAIAECGRNFPQSPPDLHAAVGLAKRDSFLDRLAPCADIFEAHCARIAVAEHRLEPTPHAPPVLTRSRCFARPLVGAAISAKRLAERARRIHRQPLGLFRREVVGGDHRGRGRPAVPNHLPTAVPLLGHRPSVGTVLAARHRAEAEGPHVRTRLPKATPVSPHRVVGKFDLGGHVQSARILAMRSFAIVLASRACISLPSPKR
jgi:hypothetical protein